MKKYISICIGTLITIAAAVQSAELPQAKITVRVLDEQSMPVQGATVRIGFANKTYDQELLKTGTTDAAGEYSSEGNSAARISADVRKDGFYLSGTPFIDFTNVEADRWQPWNPIAKVVLRPIGKPVALYAKSVRTTIPVLGKPCGYDLEAGDWVTPYGKGMKKDLVFTISSRNVTNTQNFDMQGELTFANPQDGLQETPKLEIGKNSAFKWERQAPENGYQPQYHLYYTWWENLHQKAVQNFIFGGKEWEGYFFRVRTVEQDGKIVSVHYGKIKGGIEVDPRWSSTCTVAFTYYFNPTPNDRNLEWDTKKNLFGKLPFMETPREP